MVEKFMELAVSTAVIIAGFCLFIYLPRIFAWFASIKPQRRLVNNKLIKIAIVIPAKDEGKIIDDILKSSQNQTYPKEYYDVHLIVKDKNDISIKKASEYGGYSYIVENQTCKGDALDDCLQSIIKNKEFAYDAYFIVDADCLLAPTCLEEMNHSLASGAMVLQAKKIVKNDLSKSKKANSI